MKWRRPGNTSIIYSLLAGYVVDIATWKKDVMIKIRIPIIKENVGKFAIIITVRDNKNQIYKINSPCIYIGATNLKSAQQS